jgi:small GTP-binding protein
MAALLPVPSLADWQRPRYDPTIEDSYSLTRVVDGRPYLLSITDTAGQEEYRAMQSSYAKQADAFLLVYDITNTASLHEQLPYFLDMISMEADAREDTGRVPPVTIIAGNKCDLNNERQVSSSEGLRWAKERGCGFMETSARECVNVEETFARKSCHAVRSDDKDGETDHIMYAANTLQSSSEESWKHGEPMRIRSSPRSRTRTLRRRATMRMETPLQGPSLCRRSATRSGTHKRRGASLRGCVRPSVVDNAAKAAKDQNRGSYA